MKLRQYDFGTMSSQVCLASLSSAATFNLLHRSIRGMIDLECQSPAPGLVIVDGGRSAPAGTRPVGC